MQHSITRALAGITFVAVAVTFTQQAHVAADLRSTVETQHQQVTGQVTEPVTVSTETIGEWVGTDGIAHADCDYITYATGPDAIGCTDGYGEVVDETGDSEPAIVSDTTGPDGAVHKDCAVIAMRTDPEATLLHCTDGFEEWS
jgi:hypothetical protein